MAFPLQLRSIRASLSLCLNLSIFILLPAATLAQTGATSIRSSSSVPSGGKISPDGQVPVVGARVYLFAVGSGGANTGPLSLLAGTGVSHDSTGNGYLLTDGSGNFNLTGLYTCPVPDPQVYLLAVGGTAGGSQPNSYLVEVSAMPVSCSQLPHVSGVEINEETTVAAAFALQSFADLADDGFSTFPTSATALSNAFAYANALVSGLTGIPTSNASMLDTMADVLAACIDGVSLCPALLTDTTVAGQIAPNDLWRAALSMTLNPTNNTTALFNLISSRAPYQPSLTSAPTTWAVALPGAPFITSITSSSVGGNDVLSITGTGFGTSLSGVAVIVGGALATNQTVSNTLITTVFPSGAADTTVQAYVAGLGSNPKPLAKYTSTLSVTDNPTTVAAGALFNAVVTGTTPFPSLTLSGTVTCTVDADQQTQALASGIATIPLSTVLTGTRTVTCTYPGSGIFTPSSASTTEVVLGAKASVKVTLAGTPQTTVYGDVVTLAISVTPVTTSPYTPTGTITLVINGSASAAITLPIGNAQTIMNLPIGTNSITATYSGDVNFSSAVSAVDQQIVTGQTGSCVVN